ncbi:MAG: response regulator [Nitrospiria bacterium]
MPAQVLVVDQNPLVQTTIENSLNSQNCEVTSVRDALSGLDLAYKIKPDLLIADLRMEGLMVYSFCARVKQKSFLSNIPIYLLVQQNDIYDESRLRQSGIVGFIQKPVDPKKLKETLSSFISRYSSSSGSVVPEAPVSSSPQSRPVIQDRNGVSSPPPGKIGEIGEEFAMDPTVFDKTIIENKTDQNLVKPDETVKIDDLMEWAQPEVSPFSEVISTASPVDSSELTQLSDATQIMDLSQVPSPFASDDFSEVTQLSEVSPVKEEPSQKSQISLSSHLDGEKFESNFLQEAVQEEIIGESLTAVPGPSQEALLELKDTTATSSVNGKSMVSETSRNAKPDFTPTINNKDISKTAAEIIEKVAWEVVPHLTEQALKTDLIAKIIEKVIWEVLPSIAEQSVKDAIKKINEEQEHIPS